MDAAIGGAYSQDRYKEIKDEMCNMLAKVGWKKDFIAKALPVLPISGWMGDNLLTKSTNMTWWDGMEVTQHLGVKGKENKMKVETLKDCLNDLVDLPDRKLDAAMRVPISGVYKIKGVGDVLAGRVEQGRSRSARTSSSSPPTPPPTPASARCSPSRCTTSASSRRPRGTTSA